MSSQSQPVTLAAEQVDELNHKLSCLRHDINNHLSLMVAAIEIIRTRPQATERMMATLVEQPPKIAAALTNFSGDLERAIGVSRPHRG